MFTITLSNNHRIEIQDEHSPPLFIEEYVRVEQHASRQSTVFPKCIVAVYPYRISIFQKRLFSSKYALRHYIDIQSESTTENSVHDPDSPARLRHSGGHRDSTNWKKSILKAALHFSVKRDQIQINEFKNSKGKENVRVEIPLPANNFLTKNQTLRISIQQEEKWGNYIMDEVHKNTNPNL